MTAATTSDYKLNPQLSYYGTKTRVWFKTDGSCLKQDKVTFNQRKVVNIYTVHEIIKIAVIGSCDNYPTLQNLVQLNQIKMLTLINMVFRLWNWI